MMHVWYEFDDSKPICGELSRGHGKVCGRTDGRKDADNENTPSAWKSRGENQLVWFLSERLEMNVTFMTSA